MLLLQVLLFLMCMVYSVFGACNVNYGPAGTTECVAFPSYYNRYQWSTCLSNAYIQQKSNYKHICSNRYAKYCYYQCMLEVHGIERGSVYSDCSCSPQQTPTTSSGQQPTTLPPDCFSPSGKDCYWYRNCLEKRYPCEATSNAYAIKYAEKFCNMYTNNKLWFSAKGQQWIDGVRKCLQVALVPLLRPWRSPSCQEIRKTAFDSHTPCYVKPDKYSPSVCDLECFEFYKIFWTIKSSFGSLDTAGKSLQGMWDIINQCGLRCTKNWFTKDNKVIKLVKMGFRNLKHRRSRRSSDDLPEQDKRSRFADKVATAIAKSLRWDSQVLDWFSYHDNTTANLYMVLADKKGFGLVTTPTPAVNLTDVISSLATAIRNSTLPIQIDGDNIWLTSLDSCDDKSCDQTQSLAMSSKPPAFPSGAQAFTVNGLLIGTSLLVHLALVFLWSTPQG